MGLFRKSAKAAKADAKKGTKRRKARRRGPLTMIAILLIASGVLRLGGPVRQVMALEGSGPAPAADTTGAETCAPPPDIAAVLDALSEREARVARAESQIRKRMQALAVADEELTLQFTRLEKAEAALRETIALADNAAENDIVRLVAVYEQMKPKEAAALFETMDPDFSAGFLARMKPEAAAAILAGLSSERAYSISVILAGRNSSVPKE